MYYKTAKIKKCLFCGCDFKTKEIGIKYCSNKCRQLGRANKRSLLRAKYEKKNRIKFNVDQNQPPRMIFNCRWCGTEFSRYKSQVLKRGVGFCSVACRKKSQTKPIATDKTLLLLWANAVKKRDNYQCAYCGKKQYLNAHHIFSRTNYATRYDIDNGITLCAGCHVMSSRFSAHKTPVEFVEWIKIKRGEDWYQSLRFKAKKATKLTSSEIEALKKQLDQINKT